MSTLDPLTNFLLLKDRQNRISDHVAENDPHAQYLLLAGRDGQTVTTPLILGGSTDNTTFEADGSMQMNGAATVWDDVYPSSVTIGSGVNAPSFTAYNGNLRAYEFLGTGPTLKDLNLGFQFYHGQKTSGTMTIHPHLHLFLPADTVGGGVIKFFCEYTWCGIDEAGAISATTISGTRTVDNGAPANNNAIIAFNSAAVSATGKGISSILMCRIYRNPADADDTWGQSVWLKSADVHIEKDTLGSREEYTK